MHLIIPPQCILISGDLRPAVMVNTSCPIRSKIVVLLCSHHSCTLSTGLAFSNTVSLNLFLGFSSFNLHHFILRVPVLVFNVFSPIYSSLCVDLGIRLQSCCHHHVSHSALDPYVTKTFLFHSLYNPLVEHLAHMMLSTISSNPSSIVITGSLFLLTLIRSSSVVWIVISHTIPLLLFCTTTEQLAAYPTISLCTPSI